MHTLKAMGIVGGAAALLLSATVAFAQERPTDISKRAVAQESQTRTQAVREEAKALMEAERKEAKAAMEARREEAKTLMELKRKEAKVRTEGQREKATQRLADIQDKVKRQTAERVAKQFEHLNTTWTDHFMRLLDRYDAIMQKIQDRADVAAGAGKNVAAVTPAIQSAKTAIEAARAAVIAQAAKTYTLDVSAVAVTTAAQDDQSKLIQNLRTAFQNVHKALFQDLFALRDGPMTNARRAVQNALQTLGQVPNVDDDDTASTDASGQ